MSKDVAIRANESKTKFGFFRRIVRFFKDLKGEFKKIVWPSKKQIVNNTIVVLVFMGVSAIAIWALDWIFLTVMSLIL